MWASRRPRSSRAPGAPPRAMCSPSRRWSTSRSRAFPRSGRSASTPTRATPTGSSRTSSKPPCTSPPRSVRRSSAWPLSSPATPTPSPRAPRPPWIRTARRRPPPTRAPRGALPGAGLRAHRGRALRVPRRGAAGLRGVGRGGRARPRGDARGAHGGLAGRGAARVLPRARHGRGRGAGPRGALRHGGHGLRVLSPQRDRAPRVAHGVVCALPRERRAGLVTRRAAGGPRAPRAGVAARVGRGRAGDSHGPRGGSPGGAQRRGRGGQRDHLRPRAAPPVVPAGGPSARWTSRCFWASWACGSTAARPWASRCTPSQGARCISSSPGWPRRRPTAPPRSPTRAG